MPRIRRVEIERFRGIRALTWLIPQEQRFVALIGPGDGCKTTILTAISRALSDSWSVTFRDTDFFAGEFEQPIVIRVAVGDLDGELLDREVAGLHLCGITADGELTHDPSEGDEACVVVELRVEADLEPRWSFHRPGESGDPAPIRAATRAKFRAFRVDDRIDAHLRWSRTSALGRLTAAQHGARDLLLTAQRAASRAASDSVGEELLELTATVQEHIVAQGGGTFEALRPGLDTSLTNSQGNLALYEADIPLTSFGLGTRRLTGAAIQQLAHPGQAVLLIDELEHGLEPHRIAHLAGQLCDPGSFAQVLVTTHSPVALQYLKASLLATVRRGDDGTVTVDHLDDRLQAVLRAKPAAFLARHVLIAEGKTELGIAMQLIEHWDEQGRAASPARPGAAALGICSVEGDGSGAPQKAELLHDAGYRVTYFLDGDRPDTNAQAAALEARGVQVVRWADGQNTEQALCAALSPAGLKRLFELAVTALIEDQEREEQEIRSILSGHLRDLLPEAVSEPMDPTTWAAHGVGIDQAQALVAEVASSKKPGWFKRIESGKRLGRLLCSDQDLLADALGVQNVLRRLRDYLYPSPASPAGPAASVAPASDDR